jgi:hypothetical protein
MKQLPFSGPTNITYHNKEFGPDAVVLGICALLTQSVFVATRFKAVTI